jgi:hypothetical protein
MVGEFPRSRYVLLSSSLLVMVILREVETIRCGDVGLVLVVRGRKGGCTKILKESAARLEAESHTQNDVGIDLIGKSILIALTFFFFARLGSIRTIAVALSRLLLRRFSAVAGAKIPTGSSSSRSVNGQHIVARLLEQCK